MSDLEQHRAPFGGSPADEEMGREPITALLQSALSEPPLPDKSLLPSIQHRISVQTRGRYFHNRRTKMRDPYLMLLMAALLILAIVAAAFVALSPLMDDSEPSPAPRPSSPKAPSNPGER